MTTESTPAEPAGPGHGLDVRAELSEFLRTRRARLQPADVGLPEFGRRRRVPGLRREELAQLAGVSVAYYTRLEQGNGRNVSNEVLDAIATALRLSEAEHSHLFHLARAKRGQRRPVVRRQQVRPALAELLASLEGVPAYVWGRRTEVLAWNRTAAAVFGRWMDRPAADRSWAKIVFLDPGAHEFYMDWEHKASDVVGQLRFDAGQHASDPLLTELIGELSVKSGDFRRLWAAHDVKRKSHGDLRIRHELVGELPLRYETFTLPDDAEQSLSTYHVEPGPARESLRLLTSWNADTADDLSPASDV
ncbi:helix-turn-helix domain-containing protein [Glycomyces harbinensis]|uniref:Helix-turn-helix domain-containing protein n=1 Tax=Glycomyces harbinensis TaxID=58114 RepID=A0A1G6XNR6_9ACTN|nr:helix-turn-helix transcriptional regulator [Glycomyces harbinensis]SDD79621.1 Helix-turn-helix domain-containing protein [Glycomyces harbinensis]